MELHLALWSPRQPSKLFCKLPQMRHPPFLSKGGSYPALLFSRSLPRSWPTCLVLEKSKSFVGRGFLCLISIQGSHCIKWLKKTKTKYVSLNSSIMESLSYWESLPQDSAFWQDPVLAGSLRGEGTHRESEGASVCLQFLWQPGSLVCLCQRSQGW